MTYPCRKCGTPLETNWKMCPVCETPVSDERRCEACGESLEAGIKECPKCGSPVSTGVADGEGVSEEAGKQAARGGPRQKAVVCDAVASGGPGGGRIAASGVETPSTGSPPVRRSAVPHRALTSSHLELVEVIAPGEEGRFLMGSEDGNADRKPVHEVVLDVPYALGTYPVTFDLYDKYCKDTGKEKPDDEGWGRERMPVINVNWYDAVGFCDWLSKEEGLQECYRKKGSDWECDWGAEGYRLPTEAEWEYAARGGSKSLGYKYAGNDTREKAGWFDQNSWLMTHSVGEKNPNEIGLFDMSGNVWEWCWDLYGEYNRAEQRNPRGPKSGKDRCLRGGSWSDGGTVGLVVSRYWIKPVNYGNYLGFRVLRVSPSV